MGEMTEQDRLMLEYLMGAGAMMPEQQNIERQRMMLGRLRQQSQVPQGDYTPGAAGAPSIYVQPHVLQNLAALVGQGVAGYGENQLNKRATKLGDERVDLLAGMADQQFPGQRSTEMGQGNVNRFADMVKRLRSKSASANMGSTGRTITMDQGDYGGSL
jgi:hypothetical protein